MTWAAYGPQKPSDSGIRWHAASENDIRVICIPAGHNASGPATERRPQQDSNLRSRLRRPLLSPLSYGGCVPPKGYQPTVLARTCAGKRRNHRPGDATLTRVAQRLGRVLVVDDDEVIRRLISVNLQLEGFDVSTAVDGQDCLDKVGHIGPDVITLDVMMPRLDGWETAIQLRKSPDTAHIKVVLITARAQEDDKSRARDVGADAYLTKPFDPNEMIRIVRELADRHPG
jgi:CheY-like chemotaxis protein